MSGESGEARAGRAVLEDDCWLTGGLEVSSEMMASRSFEERSIGSVVVSGVFGDRGRGSVSSKVVKRLP